MNPTQIQHREQMLRLIRQNAVAAISINLALACIKIGAGWVGHSFALISDGIESSVDIFSSLLLWMGMVISVKPADSNHPYGHGRIEPMLTFVIVGLLLIGSGVIAYQSVYNIRNPHALPAPFTLLVLLAVILTKEVMYRIQVKRARLTKSSAVEADAWHHRSDAVTSLTAFVGISIALYLGPGYEAADDWAALLAALIIAFNALRLARPALGEMMDEHQYEELVNQVKSLAVRVNGVLDTEKCFIRKSGLHFYVDLHVVVDGGLTVAEGHDIAHAAKDEILEQLPFVADVLIHIEPNAPVSSSQGG